jgi:hydroxyacylglutathione hydrolase
MARVWVVPCRTDNYTYLIGDEVSRRVAVIDPCDAEPVVQTLERERLTPVAILNTHHHGDHVGGNLELQARHPGLRVFAHTTDAGRIPGFTDGVADGQSVNVAALQFRVVFIPGHTRGHIAYVNERFAFVGDTLFGAGCGRLFEGTAAQMYHSLNVQLASVSDGADIFFAHEYTAANLRFASHIEPDNEDIRRRISETQEKRAAGLFTTPTRLGVERATNPFLRVHLPQIRAAVHAGPDVPPEEVFRLLRLAKDQFR